MAKKLIVNEGEKIKIINNVSKLVTRLADGDMCTWIPEDETQLVVKNIVSDGTYVASEDVGAPYGYSQVTVSGAGNQVMGELGEKTIDKNGTYYADSDKDGPFYGYSIVTVNVAGSSEGGGDGGGSTPVTGRDPDGDDAVVTVDDDGVIETKKLPVEIRVIDPPDVTSYEDGQLINFSGLYVKAYLKDGTEYGVVPNSELITPVTVAEGSGESSPDIYTPSDDITLPSDMTSLVGGNEAYAYSSYTNDWFHFISSGGKSVVIEYEMNRSDPTVVMICASTNDAITVKRPDGYGSPEAGPDSITRWYSNNPAPVTQTTINGRTFYYAIRNLWHYQRDRQYNIGVVNSTKYGIHEDEIAYILLYGNHTPGGSTQTIPLQWKRPGDKKVLETSFAITVSSSGDNNTSGSTTPGGSNNDVPQ